MVSLKPLDPSFPIERQLATDAGPIVLVNVFTMDPTDEQTFLEAWKADAGIMQRQPGYISTQLHRSVGVGGQFMISACWESIACFERAFFSPDFRETFESYPSSTIASPHLFVKVAVPGICVA